MSNLKKELEIIKKRDGELNFRANKTEEYLNNVIDESKKKQDELKKKLEDLGISRLKEDHIIKILDLMPRSVDDLKIVLQGFVITLTQDHMKKIINVVNE